ncbi:hypothetical protein A2U01_0019564 [Trifolium medium]|uniref:RRM domain-containing protein n=1 Tax=Trifolium medium TaxID=97028 RepID=A0A392NH71_9FABA|nr:hypothetical protein [Trifolium medium]
MGEEQEWQTVNRRRRGPKQPIPDIATTKKMHRTHQSSQTTYFFTDIPDSFGAKAMLNIFQKYGNIIEVVIPVKKDKGGRRFGFARFVDVRDSRSFGMYLDTIIIGRDKISVNLSRFQRENGGQRFKQNEEEESQRQRFKQNEEEESHQNNHQHREGGNQTYAHAVRKGGVQRQSERKTQPVLSFEAHKEDMERLKKAFVGEVVQPGMSYNLQNEFHMQGYFGVKVTPLGANLALLEGQEEGEVTALMEETRD